MKSKTNSNGPGVLACYNGPGKDVTDSYEETLVHTLTFAVRERCLKNHPDAIVELDKIITKSTLGIFSNACVTIFMQNT